MDRMRPYVKKRIKVVVITATIFCAIRVCIRSLNGQMSSVSNVGCDAAFRQSRINNTRTGQAVSKLNKLRNSSKKQYASLPENLEAQVRDDSGWQPIDAVDTAAIESENYKRCYDFRFLVYRCHENCGGLGDRQKGIVSAYLIALLTQRRFVIDMTLPCELEHFLIPNTYNWLQCKACALSMKIGRYDYKDLIDIRTLDLDLATSWTSKVITLSINWLAIDLVRKYVVKNNITHLEWLENTTNELAIHKLMTELFRPSVQVNSDIQQFMTDKITNRKLVCSHIRIGKNPTIPDDVSFSKFRGIPNVNKILAFLNVYNDTDKYVIYVATDAEGVRLKAYSRFQNYVSFNKSIVHIDHPQVNKQDGCEGLYNAVVEQYLLSKCDVLLVTKSNFGLLAALWRGRLAGLYAYLVSHEEIVDINNFAILPLVLGTDRSNAVSLLPCCAGILLYCTIFSYILMIL